MLGHHLEIVEDDPSALVFTAPEAGRSAIRTLVGGCGTLHALAPIQTSKTSHRTTGDTPVLL